MMPAGTGTPAVRNKKALSDLYEIYKTALAGIKKAERFFYALSASGESGFSTRRAGPKPAAGILYAGRTPPRRFRMERKGTCGGFLFFSEKMRNFEFICSCYDFLRML